MDFIFKQFTELSLNELYDILQLRAEIFVVEQNCVYNDLDGWDKQAIHLFVKKSGQIIAYARLLNPGTRYPQFSIGRVVVKQSERKKQLGIKLMKEAIKYLEQKKGATAIKLSAQKYLQRFYENLGFNVVTNEYLEDGIPHIGMLYNNN